jgi:signal transduction histidine kinase
MARRTSNLINKFAAAFAMVGVLLVSVYSVVRATRESARFEIEAQADLEHLGQVMRSAIAMDPANEVRAARIIALVSASAREPLELRYAFAKVPEMPPGRLVSHTLRVCHEGFDEPGVVGSGQAAPPAPNGCGTLLLARPSRSIGETLRADLAEEMTALLITTMAMIATAYALGTALIARPMARLTEQARRIGQGDLSTRLREDRDDEIGVLKRAVNAMCDQLLEARATLEDEATARVETLEQLRHLDRLRTVGTVASSLAHELGTPLNVVLLRGQALADGELTERAEIAEAGETVVTQVEKMSRLVRELLRFSRVNRAPRGPADLRKVADNVSALLSSMARKHKVEIRHEGANKAECVGNGPQLEQAVTNLVVNGIQAMPSGGTLRLIATGPHERVRPNSDRVVSVVSLAVIDAGEGIGADALERIFEPFYTTKDADVGTGLGLSVAQGITEEHGGWISAESVLGVGSTFTLHVPVQHE